jgi:hypothetical protein
MGTHSNDPHNRQIAREKQQQQKARNAEIEARKQAWQEAHLSRDPKLTVHAEVDRSLATQNIHRIDPRRERPREGLSWRGAPWWEERWLLPLRIVFGALLAYVIYGIVSAIMARDGLKAVGFLMVLPAPVSLLLATWANKKG